MSADPTWPTISAAEALERVKRGARGVDVRSEGECARAALPLFANVPILDDDARHHVGLAYKQRGPTYAVTLGHHLVDPYRDALVERWADALADRPADQRLILCWRGGLRSQIAAAWLAASGLQGLRVAGGYKAIRGHLLETLASPPPVLTLSGPTGSGKTEVLRAIPGALDLEAFARHRGSAFGRPLDGEQPAQATFENAIGYALYGRAREVLVEDESPLVGRLLVPQLLHARLVAAPAVIMDVPIADRVRHTFDEYVAEPARVYGVTRTFEHLRRGLAAVAKKLGGVRTRELTESLARAFADEGAEPALRAHEEWIHRLLSEYYDPSYAYGEARRTRPVLFRGARADVTQFLAERFRI